MLNLKKVFKEGWGEAGLTANPKAEALWRMMETAGGGNNRRESATQSRKHSKQVLQRSTPGEGVSQRPCSGRSRWWCRSGEGGENPLLSSSLLPGPAFIFSWNPRGPAARLSPAYTSTAQCGDATLSSFSSSHIHISADTDTEDKTLVFLPSSLHPVVEIQVL